MIIKPMIRNNICLNSHPVGCAVSVQRQIEYAQKNLSPVKGRTPRLALIIGCSNGYGLASRIAAAFGNSVKCKSSNNRINYQIRE